MYGREITLDAKDASEFAANTQLAIEATRGESGEIVGLPIDAEGHDKGDGAGWIVGAELIEGVIRLLPKWTEIGHELIGKGIRRFFSATIDTSNKVVLGGTLTNWPATRDENNRHMLRPIELASNVYALAGGEPSTESEMTVSDSGTAATLQGGTEMPDEITELEQEAEAAPQEAPAPPPEAVPVEPDTPAANLDPQVTAELVKRFTEAGDRDMVQVVESVQKQAAELARLEMEEVYNRRQRQWEVTNLAAQFIGGGKFGLPAKTDELALFLDSLNPQQYEMATALFGRITKNGVIEFQERGHARRLRQKQLPAEYHSHLKAALEAGTSREVFFAEMELGSPSDYDLSEFKEVK
jgi:hypothetical protein